MKITGRASEMRNNKDPLNLATKKPLMSIGREILMEKLEWKPCWNRLKSTWERRKRETAGMDLKSVKGAEPLGSN